MFIALNDNNERIEAKNANKGKKYFCPVCHEKVLYRECTTKASHFAHKTGSDCVDWGDMSEWHLGWQEKFPIECREVVMEKNGVKHRADVFVKEKNLVIEFQHSSITNEDFNLRNKFYVENGYTIIWIFDGEKKIKNPEEYEAGMLEDSRGFTRYDRQTLEWKRFKHDNELLKINHHIIMLYEVYNKKLAKKVLLPVANYNNFDINFRWMADYIYPESLLKSYSTLYKDDAKSFEQIDKETTEFKILIARGKYSGGRL